MKAFKRNNLKLEDKNNLLRTPLGTNITSEEPRLNAKWLPAAGQLIQHHITTDFVVGKREAWFLSSGIEFSFSFCSVNDQKYASTTCAASRFRI